MSTVENNNTIKYRCTQCNICYKDKSGLWYHNKRKHITNTSNITQTNVTNIQQHIEISQTELQCNYCNKILSRQDNLKRHYKNCKTKNNADKNQSTIDNKQNIIIANLTNEIERLKSDFKIILNSSLQLTQLAQQAEPNETIVQTNQTKKSIPIIVKRLVWNKYIGEDIGKSKCYCCKLSYITQLSFHCGHVVAEKNGGDINVDNLRPICQSCNSSMGINNMDSYITKYSLHKSNNDIEV